MMWIVGLIGVALVLIFCEVLLPGGLLGVLAACCMIAATAIASQEYGILAGAAVFIGSLVAALVLTIVEFKFFANTRYGKSLFLKHTIQSHLNPDRAKDLIIGQSGTALTRLNPSGKIHVDDRNYEAFSQDGYVEAGESVKVISQDGFKLTIQKL